jgi:apoptosis-inducing factor 3
MSAGNTEPQGPDLTHGVAIQHLDDGVPYVGHVGEDAVMLVRRGDEVFAVGATCTHYSGPLAEGIVVGEEIRCPWHHACFSLRTGEVTAAPAFNPLPCWNTELRNGVVRVADKRAEPAVPTLDARGRNGARAVVIIGAGAAGSAAAEGLRLEGFEGSITLIDPDARAPYDRPNLSKDFLAGSAPAEWLPLRPDGFYAEHGITRIVDTVAAVEVAEKRVRLDSGASHPYDALVLATGASPVRPPIPGVDRKHVHVLRSLDDCHALIEAATGAGRVLIAGASFIGMEAAAALRARGVAVAIVAPEKIPFSQTLGPTIGSALFRLHAQHGVEFHLGRMLAGIGEHAVTLDDHSEVAADVVLLGIGVRPRLELAAAAGLTLEGGVVVNELMESSVPGIYAVGDIARYPYQDQQIRVEHWVVAQRHGRAVARSIMGGGAASRRVPFFWTQQYDTTVSYVGHARDWTHIDLDGSPADGDFAATFMSGDRILARATIGRDRESLMTELELESWPT